jgi:membrane-bound inhibitor of C-type lysozyme
MNKNLVLGVAVLLIVGGGWMYFSHEKVERSEEGSVPAPVVATTTTEASKTTPTPIATAVYQCDGGKSITAAFFEGEPVPVKEGEMPVPTGSVELTLDGVKTTLPQTISADGARYANTDESLVFWNKGTGAFIMHKDKVDAAYTNCVAEDNLD